MAVVTMRQLLESGVHFGHQTRRWNPKMKRFIMTERNGIYIIDLQQSLAYIDRCYAFVKDTVARGGTVMFVGTKKQAQEAIAEQAIRVGMPYVNQRWLGGMLTNFQTVHQRINRLKELDEIDFEDVAGSGRTKKELLGMKRERDKLEKTLGGIREMTRTPSAGIVGAKLLFPDGSVQPSCRRFPTLSSVLVRRTPLRWFMRESGANARHLMLDHTSSVPVEVDWLLGACLFVRRTAINDVGLMDEGYFLYVEDIDWCYRMHQAGWKVFWAPEAEVVHHHLAVSDRRLFSWYSWIHLKSMARYYRKHMAPGILRSVMGE